MVDIKDPIYDFLNITSYDDIIFKIINTKVFQRLKGIKQAGITGILSNRSYSRYEHSIGVYLILKYLECPLRQCIGGLIHDIYHTNFSHVTDEIFSKNTSFHEENKFQFISECGRELFDILKEFDPEHGIEYYLDEKNFNPTKNKQFGADTIDYILRDAYYEGFIQKNVIKEIFDDMIMFNDQICLQSNNIADNFTQLSIKNTDEIYMVAQSKGWYIIFSEILCKVMEKNIITREMLIYGFNSDREIYDLIKKSDDTEIKNLMETLEKSFVFAYNVPLENLSDWKLIKNHIKRRLRYVKPPLLKNNELIFTTDQRILKLIDDKIKEYDQEVSIYLKIN